MFVEGRYDAERRAELERELFRLLAMVRAAGVACTESTPMRAEDLGMDASAEVAEVAETPSDRAATAKTTAEILNMVGLPQWLDRTIISTIAKT